MSEKIKLDIRYVAGLVDGEGWIGFGVIQKKWPTIYLTVTNTNLDILVLLKEQFGGGISSPKKREKPNHKLAFHWSLTGQKAIDVIKELLPYLIIKKYQAQLVELFEQDIPKTKYDRSDEMWDESVIEMYKKLFADANKKGV